MKDQTSTLKYQRKVDLKDRIRFEKYFTVPGLLSTGSMREKREREGEKKKEEKKKSE